MNPTKVLSLFLTFAAAAFLMTAKAQDVPVPPQEIKAAWVGKTIVAAIGSGPMAGKTIQMQLKTDGSAEVAGAISDSGTWRLSEQGYCATWKKIRAGQERCLTVVRKGAEIQILNPDGSLNSTVNQVQ